jgi:hypothetical protein
MAEFTGVLEGFKVRNDFLILELEGGPSGIGSKREAFKDAAKELVSQRVTVTYDESDSSKINENTGKPYKNRLGNTIVPAKQQAQDPAPAAPQAAAPSASGPDDITTRERAWIAAAFLNMKAKDASFETAKSLSRRIYHDILSGDWGGFGAPDDPDTDIPF